MVLGLLGIIDREEARIKNHIQLSLTEQALGCLRSTNNRSSWLSDSNHLRSGRLSG